MSEPLRQRTAVLTIAPTDPGEDLAALGANAIEIKDLRFAFQIQKTKDKEPNTATITIWNLTEEKRALFQQRGSKVLLEAGYPATVSAIFTGDVRHAESFRVGPDWETRIELGDGERAFKFSRVRESFAPGARHAAVLTKLAEEMGLDAGNINSTGLTGQFVHGHVAAGTASIEFDRVVRSAGYEWSIQDGKIQLLARDAPNTESIVVLSADSGLVGSPEFGTPPAKNKPRTLKGKSLLNPRILVGRRIELDSEKHKGIFRVISLTHSGDTHGPDWYTDFEAVPL